MSTYLDPIDRRIIGVLQVDGRASFKDIADILALPERTVSRRGQSLLAEGKIQVIGLIERESARRKDALVLRIQCSPGANRVVATGLTSISESIFVYLTSGSNECFTEIFGTSTRMSELLLDHIPSIPGVVGIKSYSCLKYFRTAAEWDPGLLTIAERAQIPIQQGPAPIREMDLQPADLLILEILSKNGRATYDQIARVCGLSEATARRRTAQLLDSGSLSIHVVINPADIGLPIESWIWIRAAQNKTTEIAEMLLLDNRIRYLSAISGDFQLLAQVVLATKNDLSKFLNESNPWVKKTMYSESYVTLQAFKRSGKRVN